MSAHTPGPWRVSSSGLGILAGPADPDRGYPEGRPVAFVRPDATSSLFQRLANGRVMAEAPELLECCEQLVLALSLPIGADARAQALRRAEQAIRRVRGS